MSPTRSVVFVIFMIYLGVAVFLVANLRGLDLSDLARPLQSDDANPKNVPAEKVDLPPDFTRDFADEIDDLISSYDSGKNSRRDPKVVLVSGDRRTTLDWLADLLYDGKTPDGTLNSAATVYPYFTR